MKTSPTTSRTRWFLLLIVAALGIALSVRAWHESRKGGGGSLAEREARVHAHPEDAQAQLDWGDALASVHRDDEAEAAYKAADSLVPNDPRPLNALGMLALERKRTEEALRYFKESLKRMPNDANIWRASGLLLQTRDPMAALEAFQHATEFDPNDAVSWRQLGFLEVGQDHLTRGLNHLQRAAGLAPNDAITQGMLGDAALRAGKPALAQKAFEKALSLRPDDPQALLGSADVILQLDPSPAGLTRAGQQIDKVIAAKPSAYAYFVRGHWNLLQKRYDPAVTDLKTALQKEPNLYTAHSFLSQAYAALNQPQLARSESGAYTKASDAAHKRQLEDPAGGQGQ